MSEKCTPCGVYSNQEILEALAAGHIVCHPFNPAHLAGSSVDVTLGKYYYRTEYNTASTFYNPFSQKEVEQYFGQVQEAVTHQDWVQKTNHQLLENIPPEQLIIVLKPGERILAHTQEFIGIKPPGTSTMQSRSTWGKMASPFVLMLVGVIQVLLIVGQWKFII